MASIVDTYECKIADIFPAAIENGDTSSLNTLENTQLQEWLEEVQEMNPSTRLVFEYEEDDFSVCDIMNLDANCVKCTVNFMK